MFFSVILRGNHIPIFQNAGLEVRKYSYYDAANSDLDFDNMIKDIKEMPEGSTILLHACAHNVSYFVEHTEFQRIVTFQIFQ